MTLGLTEAAALSALSRCLEVGTLTVTTSTGESRRIVGRSPGPEADIVIRTPRVFRRLAFGGALGLAESYLDGDWESSDLAALLQLGDLNRQALSEALRGTMVYRGLARLAHLFNDNDRRGSRRNIAAHYDLGNRFYERWLDRGMTYSSALFGGGNETLEAAQERKYRTLADDIGLAPGHRVLEIGCGWGGFAELAAREYGASVVGLTLSREQRDWAAKRMQAAGLAERVDIRLQDYREVQGQFDRVVSIEMIEAVGERWWPTYFGTIRDRLVTGGRAGIQAITIDDGRFPLYRKSCDFIQRYVFPGGMLPSPTVLFEQAKQAGLSMVTTRRFGRDYDRTLGTWNERFQSAWSEIASLGYGARFKRLWEFYLAYCRAGFRNGSIDVSHVILGKDGG